MTISYEQLQIFRQRLIEDETAMTTVQRYMGVAGRFAAWVGERELTKELLLQWRAELSSIPATVNVAVSAVNRLLDTIGFSALKLRHLKVQNTVYRPESKELSRGEYERLVTTAEQTGKKRLARLIETICVLGIRVSELQYVTVEALERREITITNKGKTRTILMSAALTKKLTSYCREKGIKSGAVFITRSGKALRRTQIWAEMKKLCALAGVEASKVFPHNLRHLFAVTHYRLHKDVVRLADLLGHSSVNTTRIYLKTSGLEHQRELEAMGLVIQKTA